MATVSPVMQITNRVLLYQNTIASSDLLSSLVASSLETARHKGKVAPKHDRPLDPSMSLSARWTRHTG